ncbi:NAD(P)/FAD-dependent oxidoreductase [Aquimarina mytili]|uniref:NAD(P)/FAD-dependent oxidoreductase n=1 Tax=Aquimarina mytili TaxID=874423 RepID=A0A937A216_9FLAO|nr:NAD(P)/FAD-dependent oxidoreductase [Aquimarina mytili]MBL0682969.1 NAD(P)/FAD-dependent oxidoreductase [Aquimarina mytili]
MNRHSDIIIVGGGLAGLTCAIHLAMYDIEVVLIEKESYPKHKVCGEYISNEVFPYFDFLNIDLTSIQPVDISKFVITTQKGDTIHSELPLGGFGVSRYTLDYHLVKKAKESGVQILQDQVLQVDYDTDGFKVKTAQNLMFTCDYVIGAYGKRSTLDKKLNRNFSFKKSPWLAVKGHYNAKIDTNTVALHSFKGGYCGISRVEKNKVNTCYLVNYDSFKKYKDVDSFQREVMYKNEHLKSFFEDAELLFDKPITISQINFDRKEPVEHHIFMVGDSAGLIHPLCGNGMAMAIQSAQILCELLIKCYSEVVDLSRADLEKLYAQQWNQTFSKRLRTGRLLQRIVLNGNLQQLSYWLASVMPSAVPKIIKQTHGEPLVCS